jgi:thiol-disulfide isomerase/thioredoxin
MQKLKSVEEFESLKNDGKHIFLFSADWCPDCRFIEPFMPEVESKYSEYRFIYVDRDEFVELGQKLDVYGIPSFIAYHNGKEIGRFVSKERKTKEEIENFIESL